MTLMVTRLKQVKAARIPTLMVEPVSIRLYNDSRVPYGSSGIYENKCLFGHISFFCPE